MKHLIRAMMLALAIFMAGVSSAMADASLTLVGGNTIYGNQLNPNDFGVAGTIDGLAAGTYYFSLIRTPHSFTTVNLQLSVGGIFWSNFGASHSAFIDNVPTAFSISGIIPYGVECGEYEAVKLKIYNVASQVVISNDLIIMNPTLQAPLPNFKINGNAATSPSVIFINNSIPPNITTNIILSYTGTGPVVSSYRLYLTKASSTGVPISGGATSDASWHTGPVPTSINVRSLGGGSFGPNQLIASPGYYLITLEARGGVCAYVGAAPHKALIRTKNNSIIYDNNKKK